MNNEINLISTLWNWCLLQDTYRVELAGLKNPIIKRQHKKQGEVKLVPYRHRDFSIEELLLTMEHCKEPYNHLLEFLYLTGCRIGEAGGLKWSDINFKKKTVMIERSAEYDNNKKFIALTPWPKNRTRKIIHLSEAIEIILNDLKALRINDCEFVFQLNGRPLNYGTLLSSIRRSQAKAGVLARGTHVCRIGGSKTVRRDFGNIDSVISYTGHKDPKMADHYSKLDSDDSKKVYSRVSDLILNAKLKNNQASGQSNVIRLGEHR